MKAWKFRDDWVFHDEKVMEFLNLAMQNMVNNVDYFLRDCYSKALGHLLQKSDESILLLNDSQQLFDHVLGKKFIMDKNSLQLILFLCFS